MAVHSYNKYGDNLARKKRRYFFLKLILIISLTIGIAGSLAYVFFFSSFMQITERNLEGYKSLKPEEISPIIDSVIDKTMAGPFSIKPRQNILFLNSETIKGEILDQFPVIKEVKVVKDFPHKITVIITERTALGIWCYQPDSKCQYFDIEGVLWGDALRSSGSILLLIDDRRNNLEKPKSADIKFLEAIKQALAELELINIKSVRIEIPADSGDDIRIYISDSRYILLSAESSMEKQVRVLKIFLENQDSAFSPEYIDLRIDGRVYYK